MQRKKFVVVGDSGVGKTCMLITYTNNEFPAEYIPTVCNEFFVNVLVDGNSFNVELMDTMAPKEYDRLRPLSYPGTDVFIFCFALNDYESLKNIQAKWSLEINSFSPGTPIILVGTKSDLHNDKNQDMIADAEGQQMAERINAVKYMECSAKISQGLKEVVDEAVRTAINVHKPVRTKKGSCIVL